MAQPQRLKEIEDGLTKLEQRPSSVHHRAEFDTLWTRLEELKTDTVQLGKFKDMVLKQNSKDVDALKDLPGQAQFKELLKEVHGLAEHSKTFDPELSEKLKQLSDQLEGQNRLLLDMN